MRTVCLAILGNMGVDIQVRDVPDAVFLALKARATGAGRSLSEFLRGMFEEAVSVSVAPSVSPSVTPTVCAPRAAESPLPARD